MLLYYITDRHAFHGPESEKRVRLLAKIAEAAQCGVDLIQLREKDLTPREFECLAREAVQVVRDHTPIESAGAPHLPGVGRCGPTRLLINSRTDIALAVGANGVHLTSTDISVSDVRAIIASAQLTSAAKAAVSADRIGTAEAVPFPNSQSPEPYPARAVYYAKFLVGISCHTVEEVRRAEAQGANFVVFAPVFEKSVTIPLREETGVPHSSHEVRGWASRNLISNKSREEGLAALKAACQEADVSRMPVLALGGITLDEAHHCIEAGAAGIAAIRLFQENDVAEIVRRLRPEK